MCARGERGEIRTIWIPVFHTQYLLVSKECDQAHHYMGARNKHDYRNEVDPDPLGHGVLARCSNEYG
jgi:hypothetical protein